MTRIYLYAFATAFAILLHPIDVQAQTEGTASFQVTTLNAGGSYAPRHVLAAWVMNSSNQFVKTLLRRANNRRQYLYTWNTQTGGNSVDAVTGATLSAHQTHTIVWDGRDASGNLAPDGEYRIRVEFTSQHAQGPLTPTTHISFTKGPDPVSIQPANLQYFINMSLTYAPDVETHTLVEKNSSWKFDDSGTDLHATTWKTAGYDDSGWDEGPGILGYGDSPTTTLDYGGNSSAKYPCYYLRHSFPMNFVPDSAKLLLLRDDGAVVYLNGTEIARDNMDAGVTAYSDFASDTVGSPDETAYFLFQIDPAAFVVGTNVLAVEVHQADAGSSDLSFDLELKSTPPGDIPDPVFLRGDVDSNGVVEMTDAIATLNFLFVQAPPPSCFSAADANDDAALDISDGVSVLLFLFLGEFTLPPPFPECDVDPTPDELGCTSQDC